MNMMNTQTIPCRSHRSLAMTVGGTSNARMSPSFADAVGVDICVALAGKAVGLATLSAPELTSIEQQPVRGALCLVLQCADGDMRFLLPFGAPDLAEGYPWRVSYRANRFDVVCGGGALLACFDEAWAVVCRVIERVRPESLSVSM